MSWRVAHTTGSVGVWELSIALTINGLARFATGANPSFSSVQQISNLNNLSSLLINAW